MDGIRYVISKDLTEDDAEDGIVGEQNLFS